MKFQILILMALSLLSLSAFAEGRNLAVCRWTSVDSDLNRIIIHEDAGGQLVALYTTESLGGSEPTLAYKVEQVPVPRGQLGGGLTYEGRGIKLHINTDSPATESGSVSYLSLPNFKIVNQRISCKVL